ncbi:HAMP domain-containing sensor histidine kinase [Diplocloster hominis]|uniref:sensor histidine kinase n=1 Tax=Diplocloster hominis TaxID=3079010 RepID=UPI0031BAD2C8
MNRKRRMYCYASVLLLFLGLGAFCGLFAGWWTAGEASRQVYGVTAGVMAAPEDAGSAAAEALKRPNAKLISRGQKELERFGYTPEIFVRQFTRKAVPAGMLLFAVLAVIWLVTRMLQARSLKQRVEELTKVLRTVNRGGQAPLPFAMEDDFSRLEDELGKTVNELKRSREEAVAVQKSLAENLADISHQLKTPVSSMKLMAEMLKDEVPGEGQIYIGKLEEQIDRMNRLVTSLLTLSRLDAGTLPLKKERVDIASAAQAAADTLSPVLSHQKQIVEIQEGPAASICADFYWTVEIFINLLKNSSEHTPAGGRILVSWEPNPIYTQVSVEDNGPGFAKEDLPNLFRRFYRGSSPSKDGIGIGLALARKLAQSQDASLTAENNPTGGACFILRFYH